MGADDKPFQGNGPSRSERRNARAKVKKMTDKDEKALTVAYERARQLLLEKVTNIRALEKEVAALRGAMLGIIEAYDLTAEQANTMLGFTYFADQSDAGGGPDLESQIENVIEKTAAAKAAKDAATPEPEPVEGDDVTVG